MKRLFFLIIFFGCSHLFGQLDSSFKPIVFVHGFLASGDTWATQIQRFEQADPGKGSYFVYDWNTTDRNKNADSLLDLFIGRVLRSTGFSTVDLVGHSAGGGLCYSYLGKPEYRKKVGQYIHVGSFPMNVAPGGSDQVPMMQIYSKADRIVAGGKDILGALNLVSEESDHLQVAASEESFRWYYKFLRGKEWRNEGKEKNKNKSIKLGGRVVSLGENIPGRSDTIMISAFDIRTGNRIQLDKLKAVVMTDSMGYFLLPSLDYDAFLGLECVVHARNARPVAYYIKLPAQHDANIYLRTIPVKGMAAFLLKNIPSQNDRSALALYAPDQALIGGRDIVEVNGASISNETITPASKTVASLFLYDDGDAVSGFQMHKVFAGTPFLAGVDVFLPASGVEKTTIQFNKSKMIIPALPSSIAVQVVILK